MPLNYQTSKIYKIWSPSHPGEIYIGSTTQRLVKRIGEHRRKYRLHLKGKYRYTTSFKIMEYGDAKIELIENVECKDKEELVAREGYYIRTLDCVNKVIPDRTEKERKSEKIKCKCGSVITRGGLSEHRRTKKHMNYIKNVVSSCHTSPEL